MAAVVVPSPACYVPAMSDIDLDIDRRARLWLELHGHSAILLARQIAGEKRLAGDQDGADEWLRTIVRIEELRG